MFSNNSIANTNTQLSIFKT